MKNVIVLFKYGMRGIVALLLCCLGMSKTLAQEEYASKKVTSRIGDILRWESPVATASTMSKTETTYIIGDDIRLCGGDLVTGVTFKGINLGKETTRHLTVWISIDFELHTQSFTPVDNMTKVYDGDCTILHGGTAENLGDILDIAFTTPVAYVQGNNLRMTIISEGEASSDSALFLHAQGYLAESLCATAGADGQLSSPFSSNQPFATFTVATPVRYVGGTVTDENGKGIDGATVRLNGHEWEETMYEATTDAGGQYQIRIEEGNKTYGKTATAPGHTSYDATVLQYSVLENPTIDFTLYGSVTYPANRQSSIILPVAPDPTAGRYYKLVGREGIKFIFEREQTPKANVPYVLFANKDYRVDFADMDLSVIPGRIDLDSLSMIGTYSNGVYPTASYIAMPWKSEIMGSVPVITFLRQYFVVNK